MLDFEARQEAKAEVIRREGDARSRIDPHGDHEPNEATDLAWQTWLSLTADLQDLGFSPNTMCDAAGSIAAVRAEFETKAGREAPAR
jgi:hypothetical protein